MPARTVKCLFSNQTANELIYDSDILDHGEFTDPWYPPRVIKPGAVGEWRAESDGIMTGTAGRVRYRASVSDDDGGHFEYVECAWSNPFVGGNSARMSAYEEFTKKPSSALKVAWSIEGNGPPPNMVKAANGDVEAWVDGILFPPYWITGRGPNNDPSAFYAIREHKTPQYVGEFGPKPAGVKSLRLNVNKSTEDWAGRWSADRVTVTLAAHGKRAMTAYVSDLSASPPLEFQQDLKLGSTTWVADHAVTQAIAIEYSHAPPSVAGLIQNSAMTLVNRPAKGGAVASDVFVDRVVALASDQDIRVEPSKLAAVAVSINSYIEQNRTSTVALMHGVYLTLYDVFTGKDRTGGIVRYERHNAAGEVEFQSDLKHVIAVH